VLPALKAEGFGVTDWDSLAAGVGAKAPPTVGRRYDVKDGDEPTERWIGLKNL
jgi:hypothetical protein